MMKTLLTIAAILICSLSYGQGIWTKSTANVKQNRLMADSVLIVPRDTAPKNNALYLGSPVGDSGRIAFKNGAFWGKDSVWRKLGSNSLDTTSLSSRIDQKVPLTRTITLTPGTGINITGGTQTLNNDRTWTITNTGAPSSGSNNYVQAQDLIPQPVNFFVAGKGRADRGLSGHNWMTMSSGSNANAGIGVNFFIDPTNSNKFLAYDTSTFGARGIVFRTADSLFNAPYFFNTGNNFLLAGDEITPSYSVMWHAGNDGSGSGLDADLLDGQSSSAFAPSSASANYAQIQTGADQTGNIRLAGYGRFASGLGIGVAPTLPVDVRGTDGSIAQFRSTSAGTQRALIVSVNNTSADVGLAASGAGSGNLVFLTGSTERARISMTGGLFGINESSMAAQLDVRGNSSSTGSAFRVRNSTPTTLFEVSNAGVITLPNGVLFTSGSGSPEGVVTAPAGSMYTNTTGGAGATFYVKESGVGNTGWVAK